MQAFRPEDHQLRPEHQSDVIGFAVNGVPGPVTRALTATCSEDGGLTSGMWESEAGIQGFCHADDEWVYILEGEAHVTADGVTTVLRAGDAAFFPARLAMTWVVPDHVRKVWVKRRQPLPRRVLRRLERVPAALDPEVRRRVVWSGAAVLGGTTAAGIWTAVG